MDGIRESPPPGLALVNFGRSGAYQGKGSEVDAEEVAGGAQGAAEGGAQAYEEFAGGGRRREAAQVQAHDEGSHTRCNLDWAAA